MVFACDNTRVLSQILSLFLPGKNFGSIQNSL
jgi:hypothetical protein